jgi:predicted nucleic acid-binding protein
MTRHLLDINVLIALLDTSHLLHPRAMNWFMDVGRHGWNTCPTTQNGVLRIMGGRAYGPTRFTTLESSQRLLSLMYVSDHTFIPDDASLLNADVVDLSLTGTGGDVTDTYLLCLAVAHDLTLATMDGRLNVSSVVSGREHFYAIPDLA